MAYFLFGGFRGGPDSLFFDMKVDLPINQVLEGSRVTSSAITQPIRILTSQQAVPDFFWFKAGHFGVSGRAQHLVKKFCSDSAEAIPVNIINKNGVAIAGQYFYLNILTFENSLILDETNYYATQPHGIKKIEFGKLKIRRRKLGDAHIWHERLPERLMWHELFASTEFVETSTALGLTGLDQTVPLEEV